MKKVFLSAIMMIAFSGASRANDIAENKEVGNAESKETTVISKVSLQSTSISSNCKGVWLSVSIYARNHGASDAQADCIAWAAYTRCLGYTDMQKATAELDMGPAC